MRKFNKFEKSFITACIEEAVERAEAQLLAHQSAGSRTLYAPGYFVTVGQQVINKINSMTLKKYQD